MKFTAGHVMLIALGVVLGGCASGGVNLDIPGLSGKVSDEEQIARLLEDVHLGMETRKVSKIMRHVSPNYLDEAVWKMTMRHPVIQRGLLRAGFSDKS